MTKTRRSIARRRVLGLLFAIVFTVVGAELALRLCGLGARGSLAAIYQVDPLLGWSHRPLARFQHETQDYRFEWVIGPDGFRDPRHFAAKAPGTLRVLVIGDSHSAGHGVAGDAAYARRLEATLCERGLACQVINASVDGYTTAQEVAFLRERARALEIDIAVVGVYLGNDLLENLSPNGLAGWKRPLLSDRFLADPLHAELEAVPVTPGSPLRRCQDFLADHSRLYVVTGDLLKETGVIQRGLTSEGRAAAQSCGGCWNQLLWQHAELEGGARAATAKRTMVSSMLAAQRIAESAHEHLLFVLIPCRAQVAPALESDPRILAASEQLSRWQDEIVAELANRVALLDLLPAFRAAQVGGGGPLYFKLDWHLDERGHELAAREIADELGQQRGWLK